MKVDAQRGAFVSQVMPGSAAAKAVKAGDSDYHPERQADQQFRWRACAGRYDAYRQQSRAGPAARRQTGQRYR